MGPFTPIHHPKLCSYTNQKPPKKLAVGELVIAHQMLRSLTVKRLPNQKLGMTTMQKTPNTSAYDAFAPDVQAYHSPEPNPSGSSISII